ncbi:MAG TPA: amino acid adenylation domain-containing protein, partial [Solirubrobacteraceae bacterium]|nr:amino acid adenylation domain-containing protein [Solirubrobacteraceae bacterium]
NFFALGGDSLTATRLMTRLGAAGIAGLNLGQLFAKPVLHELAETLSLTGEAVPLAPVVAADPRQRHRPFPPTEVQRAYWLGRSANFTLGGVGSHWYWEFDGEDIDVDLLEEALNRLIARHEMLRAVFDEDGMQRILSEVPRFAVLVTDADAKQAPAVLDALRETMAHAVLDPSRWPLMDVRAVRYGDRVRLGFSFDYIVLDALSIMIVFGELSRLYEDLETELAPIDVSFRDYLLGAADRSTLQSEGYWRERLSELPPAPQLPIRIDPSLVDAPRFTRRSGLVGKEQWSVLIERGRRYDLTPSTLLATAFAEVLSAYSARPDLTLNFTLFDRREVHSDIYNVLGDFTSLLLVRHAPQAAEGWLGAARRLQGEVWDGMAHRDVSAVWVMRELARLTRNPEVSMPVVFTSALGVAPEGFDVSTSYGELVWGISQTPQVWLDCQVMERHGELMFNWDAVEELFPDGLLDVMFGAFEGLLSWLAGSGCDWSGVLPDLLPVGQRRVRDLVNATAGPVPVPVRGLHDGFFACAVEAPDRPALLWGEDCEMSRGELRERSLCLAGLLVERGLCPGEAVMVTLPKGPEQVVAVLGVLAAGGVYVPVGVEQPVMRRDRIAAGAGVRYVVGESGLESPAGIELVVLGEAVGGVALSEPCSVDPGGLAYIIYTSGSTGEPKGVMVSHRAALNTIDAINDRWGVTSEDRALAVSALDFDLSVYDIFGLLDRGGALVIPEQDSRRDAGRWLELVKCHGVTVWNSVPALLDMLLETAGEEPLRSLRLVLLGGDWVSLDLPGRLAATSPDCHFIALGGATEAGIWSNAIEVEGVPLGWRSIPYGFPLRNQRFRVVDGRGRDCPDWVAGELWIGGASVAEGYRGDPERSARQFVEHDGLRWYRTGDVGRYWPDGTLEFLGRSDHQIKIRGHRIELGEVESAIEAHPDVVHAVALTVGERPRLESAFIAREALDPQALRAFLADRLPAYMLPEQFVALGELPLSANGKIDRDEVRRLIEDTEQRSSVAHEPPRGELESTIAEIWRELLGLDAIARDENFFALGGDSLTATRLMERLRRRSGVELSLRTLFAAPTVESLATAIDAARSEPHDDLLEGGIV